MSNTARPLMSQASGSAPVKQATNPAHDNGTSPAPTDVNQGTPGSTDHDWEKRYKDLQSYHTRTTNDLKAENARLRSESTPKFTPPKNEQELALFKQENPETFAFIETIAHGIAQAQLQEVNGELETVRSEYHQTKQERAIAEMQRLHPDIAEIERSAEFASWLASKNPKIQGWVHNNEDDAELLSAALSLFKQETGWSGGKTNEASQQSGPTGAEHVPTNSGGEPSSSDPRKSVTYVWTEKEIAGLHPSEYKKYEEDIMLAHSEGRIKLG